MCPATFDLSQIDLAIAAYYLFFGFCVAVLPMSFVWSARLLVKQIFKWGGLK